MEGPVGGDSQEQGFLPVRSMLSTLWGGFKKISEKAQLERFAFDEKIFAKI